MSELDNLKGLFLQVNEQLRKNGMLELAIVNPKDCMEQKVNARYFKQEIFQQLVSNIKKDGTLESAPLLYTNEELEAIGKYEIISGHHRVKAAKEAGIQSILAFVRRDITRQELVAKQLAHNSLTGQDDAQILAMLYSELQEIDLKLASGLQDKITEVEYESLNFRTGVFKTMTFMFIPAELDSYDEIIKSIVKETALTKEDEVRVVNYDDYDKFIHALQKVKTVKNIKSNASALKAMAELAYDAIVKLEEELNRKKAEEKAIADAVKKEKKSKKVKTE